MKYIYFKFIKLLFNKLVFFFLVLKEKGRGIFESLISFPSWLCYSVFYFIFNFFFTAYFFSSFCQKVTTFWIDFCQTLNQSKYGIHTFFLRQIHIRSCLPSWEERDHYKLYSSKITPTKACAEFMLKISKKKKKKKIGSKLYLLPFLLGF